MLFPRPLIACTLALACAIPPVFAFGAGEAFAPGISYGDERTVAMRLSATGTITAVDAGARLLAVNGPRGALTFRLDPLVRNAAALRVGERVNVDYVAAFVLTPPRHRDDATLADAPAAAGGIVRTASLASSYARPLTFVADVLAVDKENHVLRLRAPGGEEAEFPVLDRGALARIRAGDQVNVAMNQAVAVGVTPVRR